MLKESSIHFGYPFVFFIGPPRRHAVAAGVVLAGMLVATDDSLAAGFAIREQSATALGNAFAGSTAGAEDLSYMFFNPAGLVRQSGHQAVLVGSYIAPSSTFHPSSASTTAPLNVPITGSNGGSDVAPNGFVPAFYGMLDVSPRFKVGLGINAPFALETKYGEDFVGRYYGLQSRIRTIDVNPAVAYRFADWLSVGLGVSIQHVDARLTSAIDFGTIGALSGIPTAVPTQQDGFSKVEGHSLSAGFNVGVLLEPWEHTRIGFSYRSQVKHKLKGDAEFTLDSAGIGAAISAVRGSFVDTDASARLTTPETASFGVYHDINDQWSVMAEAAWTNWSQFEELRIQFANPAQPDSVTDEGWRGSWFFAGGVSYRPTTDWTLRLGAAHDQTPIPDDRRTPRIPTAERTWISVGASYSPFESVSLSAGYSHLFIGDAPIDLKASSTGNTFRGNLSGESDSSVDLFTFQASVRF